MILLGGTTYYFRLPLGLKLYGIHPNAFILGVLGLFVLLLIVARKCIQYYGEKRRKRVNALETTKKNIAQDFFEDLNPELKKLIKQELDSN